MNPKVKRFAKFFEDAFDQYYQEHPAWGFLHIIMADCNCRDSDVKFCKKQALEEGDLEAYWLAILLEQLTRIERRRLKW